MHGRRSFLTASLEINRSIAPPELSGSIIDALCFEKTYICLIDALGFSLGLGEKDGLGNEFAFKFRAVLAGRWF